MFGRNGLVPLLGHARGVEGCDTREGDSMKRMLVVLIALVALAITALFAMGRTQSSAVKTCRADARGFAQENASYEAEYDSLYGATTLAQRQITELFDRDKEMSDCLRTDPGNGKEYRAVLYRNASIEGTRYLKFLLDTKQMQDFAQWEKNQQATQLASYWKGESQ